MNHHMWSVAFVLNVVVVAVATTSVAAEPERLRIIVETDAGGDPDDEQSMVRFLLYTNEWDVEGIIVNRRETRVGENLNRQRTGLAVVQQQVKAYGECFPNLVQHDPRFPKPEDVLAKTVAGYDDTEDGVNLVVESLDKPDPRPVWFLNWGTDHGSAVSCLIRALDRIRGQRGQDGYAQAKNKLRIVGYPYLFGEHSTATAPPFPILVNTFQPEVNGKRWYHRFSGITATAGGFDVRRDVLTNHGPLGATYPTNTTHPQKEGDTPTFLYVIPTGMNDPMQPTWGSWAGRYGIIPDEDILKKVGPQGEDSTTSGTRQYYWANQQDTWRETTHRENSLARWAVDLQNDFRARLEWCVKPRTEANHAPQINVNGAAAGKINHVQAPAKSEFKLDATASMDPDGDQLTFEWFVYAEPGTYRGPLVIPNSSAAQTSLTIPPDAGGKTIHVVVSVHDNGKPPLARYGRVVLQVPSP